MPYPFDLVRLAASARLAQVGSMTNQLVANCFLEGYVAGLEDPAPFVLDERRGWLPNWLGGKHHAHVKFWSDINKPTAANPPAAVRNALLAALPGPDIRPRFARRFAGGGSRGRPRYVAVGEWRGGRIVREAKALVPSAWDWAHGRPNTALRFLDLAAASSRASDPFLSLNGKFIVRRLAPDAQKAELGSHPGTKLDRRLLRCMGREIGSLHAIETGAAKAILADLKSRPKGWLFNAGKKAATFVADDFAEWCSR